MVVKFPTFTLLKCNYHVQSYLDFKSCYLKAMDLVQKYGIYF